MKVELNTTSILTFFLDSSTTTSKSSSIISMKASKNSTGKPSRLGILYFCKEFIVDLISSIATGSMILCLCSLSTYSENRGTVDIICPIDTYWFSLKRSLKWDTPSSSRSLNLVIQEPSSLSICQKELARFMCFMWLWNYLLLSFPFWSQTARLLSH